jgi:XTP/dITP diphosphohydrolase
MSISRVNKLPYKKLLIASNNPGKVKEITYFLDPFGIEIVSLIGKDVVEPVEDQDTYSGNAELKARYYGQMFNLPALADDSGLSITALDGFPGVISARIAGENKDFNQAFELIKKQLNEKGVEYSEAYFFCALAFWHPHNDEVEIFEGQLDGVVEYPPVFGGYGFGYSPIFRPEGFEQKFSELNDEIRNNISHRSKAFSKFIDNYFRG